MTPKPIWQNTLAWPRTRALQTAGFRVLRVWNNEVLENIEGVLMVIEAACRGGEPQG